jgi:hypothetical protein
MENVGISVDEINWLVMSAPIFFFEIVIGYVGATASKSFIIGLIILGTVGFFVPLDIAHPVWMTGFLILTCVSFSLFGFIIDLWATNFDKLQFIPMLVITPLVFLVACLVIEWGMPKRLWRMCRSHQSRILSKSMPFCSAPPYALAICAGRCASS